MTIASSTSPSTTTISTHIIATFTVLNFANPSHHFQELGAYKDKHGHCNVPAKEGDLGAWVKQQRYCKTVADHKEAGTLRKTCKSGAMPKERQGLLESIGFQWKIAPPITGWGNRYEQLLAYKAANGHCNVPQYYKPDKYFGRWVMKWKGAKTQIMRRDFALTHFLCHILNRVTLVSV
jgi:hypothetical protein